MSKQTITIPLKSITINRSYLILITSVVAIACVLGGFFWVRAAFQQPDFAPGDSTQDFAQNILGANNADNEFDSSLVTASTSGSIIERLENLHSRITSYPGAGFASTSLTITACESASDWEWFEDANGNGLTGDPEDGICVQATTTYSAVGSWNGMDYSTWRDATYIAGYSCAGSFPNGYVASYSGIDSAGSADNTWDDGDCALCQADCYDGRKDLPEQIGQDGGAYTGEAFGQTSHDGPITPEVLKNWKGTRLPTFTDFFGYCGASDGDADDTAGDSKYYSSGASTDKTIGDFGHNAGRGGEYIDLSNSSYEWLSEQHFYPYARIAGSNACSIVYNDFVYNDSRFRSVFRP